MEGANSALFNLHSDLAEATDLTPRHLDVVKELENALSEWEVEMEVTARIQPSGIGAGLSVE